MNGLLVTNHLYLHLPSADSAGARELYSAILTAHFSFLAVYMQSPTSRLVMQAEVIERQRWKLLCKTEKDQLNPCNSPLHPAVKHAGIQPDENSPGMLSIQEAYSPSSECFGCGE